MGATSSVTLAVLLLAIMQFGTGYSDNDDPIITISQGTLIGQKSNSENIAYYSFLGIPYAKPPLGELRFKAPIPPEPWNGTFEASQEGSVCTQPDELETTEGYIKGGEDCLFVNVYTPQLPDQENLLPVLVWIHGGGFTVGSGNFQDQGPEFLLSHGIVYVSMNYRLGVLGFLTTEDDAAPGNVGLKDQVLALQWVQKNIAAFGGDPEKVTIFGESAGGTSVSLHLLSPMSEGLFRGVISDSRTAVYSGPTAESARQNAFLVGNVLGYTGNSTQELVEFLRTVDNEVLVTTARTTKPEGNEYQLMSNLFTATVEPTIEGEVAFLSESPITLLDQGKFRNLPIIAGINSAEGLYFLYGGGLLNGQRSFQELDEDFVKTFKSDLRKCGSEACDDEAVLKWKSYYFGDQPLTNASIGNLTKMLTDIQADLLLYEAQRLTNINTAPVFLFEFSYDGGLAYFKHRFPVIQEYPGVSHGDELGYIFDIGVETSQDSKDAQVRSQVVTMWTNFVKTGNPTSETTEDIPEWLPYTNSSTYYLDIGSQLVLKTGLRKTSVDFLENLYKNYTKT